MWKSFRQDLSPRGWEVTVRTRTPEGNPPVCTCPGRTLPSGRWMPLMHQSKGGDSISGEAQVHHCGQHRTQRGCPVARLS